MDEYIEEEHQIQHFGFSSAQFILELRELGNDLFATILEQWKSYAPEDLDAEKKLAFHSEMETLRIEAEKIIKRSMENLKADVRAFFAIPKTTARSPTAREANIQNLEQEIAELEKQYIKKKAFVYLCEKELEILESLEPVHQSVAELVRKSEKFRESSEDFELQKLTTMYEKLMNKSVKLFKVNPSLGFEGTKK